MAWIVLAVLVGLFVWPVWIRPALRRWRLGRSLRRYGLGRK